MINSFLIIIIDCILIYSLDNRFASLLIIFLPSSNLHKIFAIKEEDWNKGIRKPQWYSADELKDGDLLADLEED